MSECGLGALEMLMLTAIERVWRRKDNACRNCGDESRHGCGGELLSAISMRSCGFTST